MAGPKTGLNGAFNGLEKEIRIRGSRVNQEKNQAYFYRFKTKVRRRAPPDYFPLKIGECKLNKFKYFYTVVFAMT
jgi:hypothetical protein